MISCSKFRMAVLATFASLTLVGCMAGVSDPKTSSPVQEVSCTNAEKEFDTAGSLQPSLLLTQLPVGIYRHVSNEIRFENTIIENPTNRVTRVQFLETPVVGRSGVYSTGLRCRESIGREDSFFESTSVLSDFTVSSARLYTYEMLAYSLNYNPTAAGGLTVIDGGGLPNASAGVLMTALSSEWNANYFFARRAANTYEFHGIRISGNLTIRTKAVYTRSDR